VPAGGAVVAVVVEGTCEVVVGAKVDEASVDDGATLEVTDVTVEDVVGDVVVVGDPPPPHAAKISNTAPPTTIRERSDSMRRAYPGRPLYRVRWPIWPVAYSYRYAYTGFHKSVVAAPPGAAVFYGSILDETNIVTGAEPVPVGIIGASGYAGGELVRLLDDHPGVRLEVIAGHSSAGRQLGEVHPHLLGGDRVLASQEEALAAEVSLMYLALPHGASAEPAMTLLGRGVAVADLGSDFRIKDHALYQSTYGAHPFPAELGTWPYGLPELFRDEIAGSDRVAVPGCYPTAAILALAPLVAAELVDMSALVVDAMSGASGAGRAAKTHLSFGAIDEGVRAYGVASHRHRPEMEQAIAAAGGVTISDVRVSFTPHLVPMQRGILSTASAPLDDGATIETVAAALTKAYGDEAFVDVVAEPPSTRWVVGSNRCLISAHIDDHTGRVIVIAAIDNLLKGAAGQAVQCANLMLGLPETMGLPLTGWMP